MTRAAQLLGAVAMGLLSAMLPGCSSSSGPSSPPSAADDDAEMICTGGGGTWATHS